MSDFKKFAMLVNAQLASMSRFTLFQTDVDKDELWELYLDSFKPYDNPVFRERAEHDCNCCKNFIRAIGGAVTVIDGHVTTVWDLIGVPEIYQPVITALANKVRASTVETLYLYEFAQLGKEETHTLSAASGVVETWSHFHFKLPAKFVSSKNGDAIRGTFRTNVQTLKRAYIEISDQAVETVLELIDGNSIYRGAEFRNAVFQFKGTKQVLSQAKDLHLACLEAVAAGTQSAGIRNSSIGTLLVDLSDGVSLEEAVKAFEFKVAPSNYKRPSALVTPAMVARAEKTIEELGLASALPRRPAVIEDLTINNVLFANRVSKVAMVGGALVGLGVKGNTVVPALNKLQEVSLNDFLVNILPGAESVELLFENRMQANLVNLIAPVDSTAPNILKWGNNFSWSYNGDVTDSIKERVKAAGGNVTGEFRASLAWFNHDDLDIHLHAKFVKGGSEQVYFGNNYGRNSTAQLDVDANRGSGNLLTNPVENITVPRIQDMPLGDYTVKVNSWAKRKDTDVGFEVELEILGEVHTFTHTNPVRDGQTIDVVTVRKAQNKPLEIIQSIGGTAIPVEVWGLTTNQFVNVSVVMNSPNHWDGEETGNKHVFFMLDNCVNPEGARGIYNEFLRPELYEHRKVFELVGAKMKTTFSENQLSGLGFSSTVPNHVVCRVKGQTERTFKLVI